MVLRCFYRDAREVILARVSKVVFCCDLSTSLPVPVLVDLGACSFDIINELLMPVVKPATRTCT